MNKNFRVLTLAMLAALCACHRSSQDPVPTAAAAPVAGAKPKADSAEKQTLGMVHAASPAKERTGVDLKFHLTDRPVAGSPIHIELALFAHFSTKNVVLQLTPGDGLTLAPGAANASVEDLAAESVYRTAVDVSAAAPGIAFLNAVVTFDNGDSAESRDFSIPIIVGS